MSKKIIKKIVLRVKRVNNWYVKNKLTKKKKRNK